MTSGLHDIVKVVHNVYKTCYVYVSVKSGEYDSVNNTRSVKMAILKNHSSALIILLRTLHQPFNESGWNFAQALWLGGNLGNALSINCRWPKM